MTDAGPFDVLGFIGDGRRYEDISDSIRQLPVDGLNIRVLSVDALIAEKRALGREKDLAMLRILEAVQDRTRQP